MPKVIAVMDAGPDIETRLRGGDGFDLSATVAVPVGRREIRFGPTFRHWSIDRSDSKSVSVPDMGGQNGIDFFEPRNRTSEYVLRVSLAF